MKKILCLLCIGICPLILSFIQPFSVNHTQNNHVFCISGRPWWSNYPRLIAFIIFAIAILMLFLALVSFILNFCLTAKKKKHFDYHIEYKEFKPKDEVKVFFMHDQKIIKKTVQLVTVTNEELSFKDNTDIYKCTPSKIIYIQKPLKKTRRIALVSMVCLLMALSFLIVFKIWDYQLHQASLSHKNENSGFFC